FRAAIERDSTYALAWSGLAKTYVRVVERQFAIPGIDRDSLLRVAVAAVDRALALDSTDADAWAAKANVTRRIDPTDVNPVVRAARKAIALDSANGPAWHFLALSLAELGDMSAALEAWRQCVRANPSYTMGLAFLALGHYWRGQYDSAVVWADSAVALEPSYLLGRTTLGQIEIERGNFARAIAAFEAARRLATDVEVMNTLALRALAEARAGRATAARSTLRLVDSLGTIHSPTPIHPAINAGQAHVALGDVDRAIGWLTRYPLQQDLHYQLHLRCDPPFAAIANDRRFRSLVIAQAREGSC
ncbi:MAG TPA: tetratricopeptide repeat protein, partial [Gemmatimonadaceae bacterium]|nr:tetratricopeptide repeat protein [Gemmatimonadaceae bacterium]